MWRHGFEHYAGRYVDGIFGYEDMLEVVLQFRGARVSASRRPRSVLPLVHGSTCGVASRHPERQPTVSLTQTTVILRTQTTVILRAQRRILGDPDSSLALRMTNAVCPSHTMAYRCSKTTTQSWLWVGGDMRCVPLASVRTLPAEDRTPVTGSNRLTVYSACGARWSTRIGRCRGT